MSRTHRRQTPVYRNFYDTDRDGKKWYKPDAKFKQQTKKQRKAKEKQAFKAGKETIPEFPNSNEWNWI
jgi:hypothetical protein